MRRRGSLTAAFGVLIAAATVNAEAAKLRTLEAELKRFEVDTDGRSTQKTQSVCAFRGFGVDRP